jgi:hypothetical protein
MLAGNLALMIAALFTGAGFYINIAEQPARLGLDDRGLLAEWKPAYMRGFAMQLPLVVVGGIFGLIAWWQGRQIGFLVGAVLMIANGPWTVLAIMPTNKILMATKLEEAGPNSRSLILKWNRLHAARTSLGGLATIAFLVALSST